MTAPIVRVDPGLARALHGPIRQGTAVVQDRAQSSAPASKPMVFKPEAYPPKPIPQNVNEYRFATLRSLRECLRSYSSLMSLAKSGDLTSATTMLDLSSALGDDPMHRLTVLTERQKEAIVYHLIRDQHVNVVAEHMGIHPRVVYLLVNNGLRRLLRYLQDGALPEDWQQWQLDYVRRNARQPRKELAAHIGRSHNAVRVLIYRLRKNGECIERSGRRTVSSRPSLERQSA